MPLLSFPDQDQNPQHLKFLCRSALHHSLKNPEEGRIPFKRKLNSYRETICKTFLHLTQIVLFIRYMCLSIFEMPARWAIFLSKTNSILSGTH
jgi:hypothetical protein